MREVSRTDRRGFAFLDNLGDRELTTDELTDALIELESIESGDDALRRFQKIQAIRFRKRHRRLKVRRGETHLETVALWRLDANGDRRHYIKACGALTAPEAAQHIQYWDSVIAEDKEQRDHYYQFHKKRHGRKLQRLLNLKDHPPESN